MQTVQYYTDEYLMEMVKDRSSEAFEEIYHRYSQKLLALMTKMLNRNQALAQDLLRDTFLKLLEKPELFDVKKRFKPWIYTVASNACRKTYREKIFDDIDALMEHQNPKTELPTIESETEEAKFAIHLNSALDSLSYEHKETFVLKHQQDFSIKEIASVLNCAEGTVKSRLFAARKILAQKLKTYHPKSAL